MSDAYIPWKTAAASTSVSTLSPGWNLAEPSQDDPDAYRTYGIEIHFETPFYYPPVVQIAITGFDMDQRDSSRLRLTAANITSAGFKVDITTWRDTRVYGVDFNWLAIGS